VRTAAAETNAATAAMGVLFFEMMFLWEDEAIAGKEREMEKERGSWGSFIDYGSTRNAINKRNNAIY
jgi:hypothetical protein